MFEFVEAVEKSVELRLEEFIAPIAWREGGLFVLVVAVVLSQNTSDRNAIRAYRRLRERLGSISPEGVLELSLEELEELIKPAGMYKNRARVLKALAEAFRDGVVNPQRLAEMDYEEARRFLTSLPGVGKKTADVVLLYLGHPAFPVDTHIARIARRWGVGERYDEVSNWFRKVVPPHKYLEVHLKLIQFGRDVCRARGPRCDVCPVGARCPSYKSAGRSPVT
ncbi:MAG: endonuclease III [Pyrobaculum sp.]